MLDLRSGREESVSTPPPNALKTEPVWRSGRRVRMSAQVMTAGHGGDAECDATAEGPPEFPGQKSEVDHRPP